MADEPSPKRLKTLTSGPPRPIVKSDKGTKRTGSKRAPSSRRSKARGIAHTAASQTRASAPATNSTPQTRTDRVVTRSQTKASRIKSKDQEALASGSRPPSSSKLSTNSVPSAVGKSAGVKRLLSEAAPSPIPPGQASARPETTGPNPPGQASDPEKRRQIQQQLVLLLHAHKCQRQEREQQTNRDFKPCTLPHCKTMKDVLNHMTECQAGRDCQYPHCSSSRQIITHWRNCQRADCPVCLPLKHASLQHKRDGVVSNQQLPGAMMGGPPQSLQGGGAGGPPMMAPGPSVGGGQMNFNHHGPQGSMTGDTRQVYPGGQSAIRPHPYGMHPNYPATNSTITYPVPIPHNPTQQWHQLVPPDLRQYLVRKLVEAIYPVHDPVALQDRRVASLIQYAMRVEKTMFEAATNREEYYKLLAQKIYLIRMELKDRKNTRVTMDRMEDLAILLGEIAHMWELFISSLGVSSSVCANIKMTYASGPDANKQCLAAGLKHWVMTDEKPTYLRVTNSLRDKLANMTLAYKVQEFSRGVYAESMKKSGVNESKQATFSAPPPQITALKKVMAGKRCISQRVVHLMFMGLPRCGKSSLKDRLLGRRAETHGSTGVADKAVKIQCSTVHASSKLCWKPLLNIEDEAANLLNRITDVDQALNDVTRPLELSSDDLIHADSTLSDKNKSEEESAAILKPATDVVLEDADVDIMEEADFDIMDFFEGVCEDLSGEELRDIEQGFTLYLTDTGGQPEFQALIRSAVSGPTLFLLTFRLDRDLNSKFTVEYKNPITGEIMTPYESSFTTKETIMQYLATITSIGSLTKIQGGKSVKVRPKVIFVGTHRDMLKNPDSDISKFDEKLRELIQTTDAYREGIVEYATESQLLHAVNNLSEDEGDVQLVRATVERIAMRGDNFKVVTPYSTLVFSIAVRRLNEPVLTYDRCLQIARRCGIASKKELDLALWFLHHCAGVIRHFDDIPELKGLVIQDLQCVFDKVTELVVSTFTFEKTIPHTYNEFKKKGVFPLDEFEELASSEFLTPKQLIALLVRLYVIAPLRRKDGTVAKYFAPCVLTHAKDPPCSTAVAGTKIPPLLITFDCGYCPTGMFGALVVHLLTTCHTSTLEWSLDEDTIYRYQLTLSFGHSDAFTFLVTPSHIEVHLISSAPDLDRNLPLDLVCFNARNSIRNAINEVIKLLNYSDRAAHQLAFPCDCHTPCCPAIIKFFKDKPASMKCILSKKHCVPLPRGYHTWFKKFEETADICDFMMDKTLDELARCLPTTALDQSCESFQEVDILDDCQALSCEGPVEDEKPTESELHILKWQNDKGETERLWLIQVIMNRWRDLGKLFGIPPSKRQSYATKHKEALLPDEECCKEVLDEWLSNGSQPPDKYPTTWQGLMVAITDLGGLRRKVEKLREALSRKKRKLG